MTVGSRCACSCVARVTKTSGAGVLSYLLFEAGYCRELIELGRRDAMAKREALCQFLRVPL